jgi:Uma2 family endonuclease
MAIPKIHTKKYSYADYLTWDNEERWEIIDGIVYKWDGRYPNNIQQGVKMMSPAPTRKHQAIVRNLTVLLTTFFKGKTCKVYPAPFDVRLANMYLSDSEIDTVVQPDITVICDSSKLDDKGAKGAPDFIVEVISENTRNKDLSIKLLLYQKFGVKEYWVVDPIENTIYTYALNDDGKYMLLKIYTFDENITSFIYPELKIVIKEIFEL